MKQSKDKFTSIKISFIGCGNIAHMHMHFLKMLNIDVCSVCDGSPTRARLFAKQYKIPNFYSDFQKMIDSEKPDAIHILTPPHTHYEIAMKSLESGCHILVEKPLCLDPTHAEKIMGLAKEKNLIVSVDHTRVYNRMIAKAREMVKSGKYGKLVRLEYDYDDPALIPSQSPGAPASFSSEMPLWAHKIKGGIVSDLIPHPISVILSFDDSLKIKSVSSRIHSSDVIEELMVFLSSENIDACLKLSMNIKPLKNILTIYCQKGTIKIDLRNFYMILLPDSNLPNIIKRLKNTFSEAFQITSGITISMIKIVMGKLHPYSGLEKILLLFYDAIANGKGLLPSVDPTKVVSLCSHSVQLALDSSLKPPKNKVDINQSEYNNINDGADILVTGGTGFIGRDLVNKLVADGKRVRVLCRKLSNTRRTSDRISYFYGDMKDKTSLVAALEGIKTVFHCASAMRGDWAEFYESTVQGTENLLEAIKVSQVEKLIYLSSLSVINYYDINGLQVLDENAPIEMYAKRRGFYTRAKTETEALVQQFSKKYKDKKVMIIRPGLVFGKYSNKVLQNAGVLIGKWLFVFGDGRRYLGLNYVENLSHHLSDISECKFNTGQIFHVVDEYQPRVREYIKAYNFFSKDKVFPIYIPIFIWKATFFLVDNLLYFKNKIKGTFSYRFASNSKNIIYTSNLLRKTFGCTDRYDFLESVKKSIL